jgi:hypothetical protein
LTKKKAPKKRRHKVGKGKKKATWRNMLPPLPKGTMLVFDPKSPSGFRAATSSEIRKSKGKG